MQSSSCKVARANELGLNVLTGHLDTYQIASLGLTEAQNSLRTVIFADMFKMSKASGVEFGLTKETIGGQQVFKLYSGGGDNVRLPYGKGVRNIGHTHPQGTRFPSDGPLGDMENINLQFLRSIKENPHARIPHRRVIWGEGLFDSTIYYPDILR